jgi:metallo-beta-lactamase class B
VWKPLAFCFLLATLGAAQDPVEWHQAFPPHRIAGNIYYVGTGDLASYLVMTSAGSILINTDYERDVPLIRTSVEKLGFKFSDIKIVLLSHAHDDHVAGTAITVKETGAKLMVMDRDVPAIESGKPDHHPSDQHWTPVKVDRVLHDGDTVELGGTKLVAHLTPGHTKGCTTWTGLVSEDGRMLNVVIDCSPNVTPAYKLLDDPQYPQAAQDFEKTFRALKSLRCDVFLSAHASTYDMKAKYAQLKNGGRNPFIDPAGYQAYVLDRESAFRRELKRQQEAAKK